MYPSNKWCSPRRYNNKVFVFFGSLYRDLIHSLHSANTFLEKKYLPVFASIWLSYFGSRKRKSEVANVTVWKSVVRAIKLFLSATWVLLLLLLCRTELRERKEVSFAWKTPTFTAPRVCYRSRNKIRILYKRLHSRKFLYFSFKSNVCLWRFLMHCTEVLKAKKISLRSKNITECEWCRLVFGITSPWSMDYLKGKWRGKSIKPNLLKCKMRQMCRAVTQCLKKWLKKSQI